MRGIVQAWKSSLIAKIIIGSGAFVGLALLCFICSIPLALKDSEDRGAPAAPPTQESELSEDPQIAELVAQAVQATLTAIAQATASASSVSRPTPASIAPTAEWPASPAAIPAPTPSPSPTPTATPVILGAQLAQVVQVIDGDTIEVRLNGRIYKVRYIGINCPGREQPGFQEATEANRRLVGGKTVYLVKDVSETDRYGRLLRYVYLADKTFVNLELVRQGFAQAVSYPPDIKYQELFQDAQREAMNANRGLWALVPKANVNANLRAGPGTNYPRIGGVKAGTPLTIVARNPAGDWYQLEDGAWIFAELVDNAPEVPVAQVIPTPPQPTPTPVPPTPTPIPAPPAPPPPSNCDPSYPTVCIPPPPPDLDCRDIPYRRFQVLPPDPHRFDGDHDGIGCER